MPNSRAATDLNPAAPFLDHFLQSRDIASAIHEHEHPFADAAHEIGCPVWRYSSCPDHNGQCTQITALQVNQGKNRRSYH